MFVLLANLDKNANIDLKSRLIGDVSVEKKTAVTNGGIMILSWENDCDDPCFEKYDPDVLHHRVFPNQVTSPSRAGQNCVGSVKIYASFNFARSKDEIPEV